jgi:uncharacterized protein
MLYLDSSALMKRYVAEKGSAGLNARFERSETIYTSLLSFGEIHSVLARAYRTRSLTAEDLSKIREEFLNDWLFGLSKIEVNIHTMSALPELVEKYPLKAADAIHLSAAFWLRDTLRLRGLRPLAKHELEFGAADKQLGEAAAKCGLLVFDPEQFD